MPHPASQPITFLFTDIEGSVRLWERDPEEMERAQGRHLEIIAGSIARHHGTFVLARGEGDSTFSVFRSAPDAIAACCELQSALSHEPWSPEAAIRVRAAIHTGFAAEVDGDYRSPDVNRCARLRAIAHGGQTVVSASARAAAGDLPDGADLRDMGLHRLRDLTRPERVYQLLHPALPANFPPLRSLDVLPTNIPAQLTTFVGREREMAELTEHLGSARLLTITGPGGCGKTRLALQVAAERLDRYADGAWLAELAPLSSAQLVPQTVAAALGVREEPGRDLSNTIEQHLLGRDLLLVLDNCEHVVQSAAEFAYRLLSTCPGLRILATSREPLNVAGEVIYRVPPLSVPDVGRRSRGASDAERTLLAFDSVRLFLERVHSYRPEFALDAESARPVAAVCRRLDGIPLAIELAAARVRTMPVAELNQRLDSRFRLLTGGSRTALPRHQTLRSLIDWSYELLGHEERLLLQRLSVFAGGWDLEAAEAVCADDQIDAWQVVDLLGSMVDRSLVMLDDADALPRYRLLETVREYARERLEEHEDASFWRDRHLEYLVSLAKQAEPHLKGADQRQWLERLEREHDNLRSALAWSARSERLESGLRLAICMRRFWEVRGHVREGRGWISQLLQRLDAGGPLVMDDTRADALSTGGTLAYIANDYSAAEDLQEQALAIHRAQNSARGVAVALGSLGNIAFLKGEYSRARSLFREALDVSQGGELSGNRSNILTSLGSVAYEEAQYEEARELFEEALAIARTGGNRHTIALVLNNLGSVAYELADYAAARDLHQESLSIKRDLGDRWGCAFSLCNLAGVACELDDYEVGGTLFAEGLAAAAELVDLRLCAYAIEGLARVAAARGDPVRGGRLWGAAARMRKDLGSRLPPSDVPRHERLVVAARAAAGDAAFDAAWREGEAMSGDEAIAECLAARYDGTSSSRAPVSGSCDAPVR